MTYSVVLDKDAIIDIKETIVWYNEKKPNLGNNYLEEFKRALALTEKLT